MKSISKNKKIKPVSRKGGVLVKKTMPKKEEIQELVRGPRTSKHLLVVVAVIIIIPIILVGVAFGYTELYKGKIYPGVYLAGYSVGNLTAPEFDAYISKFENQLTHNGLSVVVQKADGTEEKVNVIVPITGSTSSLYAKLSKYGREGSYVERLLEPWKLLGLPQNVPTPFFVDETVARANLHKNLSAFEDQPHNATIAVSSVTPLNYTIVAEKSGLLFNYNRLVAEVNHKVGAFDTSPIVAQLEYFSPTITSADAEGVTGALPDFLNTGDIFLNYSEEQSHFKKQWRITSAMYAPWLELTRNETGKIVFSVSPDKMATFLHDEVSPYTDHAPEDAIFRMEGEKVVEFKASKTGQGVDLEKTIQDINNIFALRSTHEATTSTVQVAVKSIEPNVKTADVNNLGITDIIGVGISTFHDSHNNRIKNIATAIKRLNGTLIKPGEEFSANHYAGPYTAASGYLPEAVIKGKEIKNEIGGGMCQIGTTLFRMAMNSAMDVTERANHSLVVNYYADPVNGNPGTDATLYEPIHDLKFKNDTGSYLLLQTDIDYTRQQLTFTLWGKPDGRKGSYTHPVVEQWLGIGKPEEVVVDTLPPGTKKCQNAFRGAVASFTYTRTTPSGEKIDRVFRSYYRSLPQICMVGKTDGPPPCPEGQVCSQPPLDTSGDSGAAPLVDSVAPVDPQVVTGQ